MRRWTILTVLAVVVVLVAGWLLLVKPQKSKITTYRTQAQAQTEANARIATQIAALQAEQKDLPAQQLALQKFSTQIPNDAQEPTLIRQFSAAAHGAGVDLNTITPGAVSAVSVTATAGAQTLGSTAATTGGLSELPITLAVTGSYPNIESFFASLEKLPRALLVTGFSITAGGTSTAAGTNTLTVSIAAKVFFTPPAATTAPAGTTPQTLTPATSPTTAATPAATSSAAAIAHQGAGQTS